MTVMENFGSIEIEDLAQVLVWLPKKKGTEKGILGEILDLTFSAI